ncbi:MAG: hypothetical protein U1E51_26335 [Candidatus Binatia bacterium]|nr:hypothetical protein [Candidatus Binatia bacterium]
MTATEIARLLTARAEEVCRHLLPNGKLQGGQWCVGSISGEAGDSLKVHLTGTRAGSWVDFAGNADDRGDLIGLWKKTRGVDLPTACEAALDWLDLPAEQRNDRSHHPAPPPKRIETRAPSETWLRIQEQMRPGSATELLQLAELRRLPVIAGLVYATNAGHLWFSDLDDGGFSFPSWILTDGSRRNAQARKCNGQPWDFGGKRKPCKAKTIAGCEASWPIGIAEAAPKATVFLVEGGPDFLACWHLLWLNGEASRCTPGAMLGVSHAIHPEALPLFKGKNVRIFPHNDADLKGMNGAIRWRHELKEAGARAVDFFDFKAIGDGDKDLNEMMARIGVPELKEVAS